MKSIGNLGVVVLALSIAQSPRAEQAVVAEPGITGSVLQPDGSPVTQGNVLLLRTPSSTVTAAIDRTGSFRVVPDMPGTLRLFISVPGFTPYRADVTVPLSRIVKLPAITLLNAIYLRARFVTADGEPLSGGLRRRFIDADGATIPDPLGHVREQVEGDGSIVIGPLPRDKLLWAFDRAPLAQTRLPDVNVAGTQPMLDRGVIVIQPGRQLRIDVRAADGTPVPNHNVWIEDPVQPSLLFFPPVRTNAEGRAVFERLAQGRFRVSTQTADRCGNQHLAVSRLVSGGGTDTTPTRLVIGGRALIRITSPLGPVSGRRIALSPDTPGQVPWQPRFDYDLPPGRRLSIPSFVAPSCVGVTDADGRVALEPFPPGPAQLRVNQFNSTYVARLNVPEGAREMAVVIPDGLIPVHVGDRASHEPIGSAQVTWTGGGGRVEAIATANGDVLLEGAGSTGGTLTVSARDYQALEGAFDETPGTQQDVALVPLPSQRLAIRLVFDGKPVAGAVVELHPRTLGDAASFTTTDAAGIATFTAVPLGTLQFTAHAEGFAPAIVHVAEDGRTSIVINLSRANPRN